MGSSFCGYWLGILVREMEVGERVGGEIGGDVNGCNSVFY